MDSRFIDVKVNGNSMWPTLRDGDIVRFEIIDLNLIKRISAIEDEEVFLVGDNPDPNASEDSHNFGCINVKDIIAVIREDNT